MKQKILQYKDRSLPIVKTLPNPAHVHLASFTRIHLVRVYGSITAGDGPNEREEGGGGDGGEVGDGVGEREGGRVADNFIIIVPNRKREED